MAKIRITQDDVKCVMMALKVVNDRDGLGRVTEVAAEAKMDLSEVYSILKWMESKGWLREDRIQ